jgi:hypothetical protein
MRATQNDFNFGSWVVRELIVEGFRVVSKQAAFNTLVWFGRHVKPLVPAAFAVASTH